MCVCVWGGERLLGTRWDEVEEKKQKQKKETDKQTQSWGGLGRCWKGWVYGVMN